MTDLERTFELLETIRKHSSIKNVSIMFGGTNGYGLDRKGPYVYGNTGTRIESNIDRISNYISYLERDFRWKKERLEAKGK